VNDRAGSHRAWAGLVAAVVGLGLRLGSAVIVRNGRVGPAERRVFDAINGLPEWLNWPLWLFQQFGNLVVAFLAVVLIAVLLRRPYVAAAAVLAVVAKLGLERVVKSAVERRRPGTSIGEGVILRGDVSIGGLSFVSGHAVITTACATVLMAVLPRRWKAVPWVVVVLNGVGRVYVGAHNPLDIVGGVGLGLVIGGLLYAGLVALDGWHRGSTADSDPRSATAA
jgi:membrane-associated phospholipid phosphatase